MTTTAPIADLRLLGGASLEGDDGPISGRGAQRRRIALLAILAVSRRPVSRDKIMGLLWEDSDGERARKLVSESIYVIRKAISEDALITSGDEIRLNPLVVRCDVVDFHDALDRGDDAGAAAVYGGPFLEGFYISDAPEFEKWVDGARDTLSRQRADALARLAAAADAAGDLSGAADWWRRLAEQDPYNSSYALGLMRALDRNGQRAAALQHARVHASLLRSEFDADPEPAIVALAEKLRDTGPAGPALAAAASHAPSPAATAPIAVKPIDTAVPPPPPPRAPLAPQHVQAIAPEAPGSPPSSTRNGRRTLRLAAAVVILLAVAATAVIAIWNDRRPPSAAHFTSVVIFPFRVPAAAAELSDGMVTMLTMNLDKAGDIRTVDENSILSLMSGKQPKDLSPARAASIARDLSADFFVLGEVTQAGKDLVFSATLYKADGNVVDHEQAKPQVRGNAVTPLAAVDALSLQLISALGVGPSDFEELTKLTSSYPAMKKYLEGDSWFRAGHYKEAAHSFHEALEIDPGFAVADYRLSAAAEWNFDFAGARQAVQRALDNSARLPARYSRLARAWQDFLNGNAEDAEAEYNALLMEYPNDVEARSGLGEVLIHFNPPRGESAGAARGVFAQLLARAFGEVRYHSMEFAARDKNLAAFDSLLNTLDRKNEQYMAWQAVRAFRWGTPAQQTTVLTGLAGRDEREIGLAAGRLAAHTHQFDDARVIAELLTRPGQPRDWRAGGHLITAELWLARGHPADAQREIDLAAPLVKDWPIELESLFLLHPLVAADKAALMRQQTKLQAWHPDSTTPSTSFFFAAHAKDHARLRAYLLGLIAIRLGQYDSAQAISTSIGQLTGDAQSQKNGAALGMSLQGHIARAKGNTDRALELLTDATIDAEPEVIALSPFFSRAHDRYVIGELYEQKRDYKNAARWYRSLLDGFDFIYAAAAHNKLAAIADKTGDRAASELHKAEFAKMWNPR